MMFFGKKPVFIFILLIAGISLVISCTNSKPEITYGFIQSVLYSSSEGPKEHLAFFIVPHDNDGIENLDELFLYNDREQLRWRIGSDEWISYAQDGRTWIGSRSITAREGSLPRGVYRAVLINKSGESTERNFTFDSNVRYPFPELEISGGNYAVRSQWPVNRLVCYDRTGDYSTTVVLTSLTGSVSDLKLPAAARAAALWAEDTATLSSAFTNIVSISE